MKLVIKTRTVIRVWGSFVDKLVTLMKPPTIIKLGIIFFQCVAKINVDLPDNQYASVILK